MNQVKNRSFTYIVVQKKNLGLINEILSYKIRHCLISEKSTKKNSPYTCTCTRHKSMIINKVIMNIINMSKIASDDLYNT